MLRGKSRELTTIIAIAIIIVIGIFGAREPNVTINGNIMKISGLHGTTVSVDEIQKIEEIKEDKIAVGSKIFGLGIGSIRKGRFHYGENSSAKVFLETNKGPYILITLKDDLIIINFRNADKTDKLYNYLKQTVNK